MVGAFAYGWPLMKDPLGGVQPIEYMLDIPREAERQHRRHDAARRQRRRDDAAAIVIDAGAAAAHPLGRERSDACSRA